MKSEGETPSTASFVKWSALTLAVIVALGVIVARVLHALGID